MPLKTARHHLAKEIVFENAIVGKDTLIESDVQVGFSYHDACSPAQIGDHGILRKGTIIYGDGRFRNGVKHGR